MQLTQHTDYAFRVLLYNLAHPERLVTITEIATLYDISRSHLAKVVANLTQHGYLIGVRGQKGGLKLGKAPEEINLGVLVNQFEPLQIAECFDENNQCKTTQTCMLKGVKQETKKAFIDTLNRITLTDLALSSEQFHDASHKCTQVMSLHLSTE